MNKLSTMFNVKERGFTLIELLVVIAIIGILASVVLASLNTARGKGADAAVKANLANIRAQAELVYDTANPNSYDGVCGEGTATQDTTILNAINSAKNAAGETNATNDDLGTAGDTSTATCHADGATGWAVEVPLRGTPGSLYCVDGTGQSKTTTTALAADDVTCN